MTCPEHKFVPHPQLYSMVFCERCGQPKRLSAPTERKAAKAAAVPRETPRRAGPTQPSLFIDDDALRAEAQRLEDAATEMANALRDEGLIPGGSGLYHQDDEPPEYSDADDDPNVIRPRDPDDPAYRRLAEESDALAPGARLE